MFIRAALAKIQKSSSDPAFLHDPSKSDSSNTEQIHSKKHKKKTPGKYRENHSNSSKGLFRFQQKFVVPTTTNAEKLMDDQEEEEGKTG